MRRYESREPFRPSPGNRHTNGKGGRIIVNNEAHKHTKQRAKKEMLKYRGRQRE